MRKRMTRRRRIPRKARIAKNLLLAAVLFCLFYIFAGCPDMTAEQGYQRALRRRLLGPGEVVGVRNVDVNGKYNRLVLGKTGAGYTLYCCNYENLGFLTGNSFSSWEGILAYREKGETVTVLAAPGVPSQEEETHVPIILFDECPGAVRAELDVSLNCGAYEFRYNLKSKREAGGYFAFDLSAQGDEQGYEAEGLAIEQFSWIYSDDGIYAGEYPAAVRLYDEKDELIYEEALFLRSAVGEAHARRGMEAS